MDEEDLIDFNEEYQCPEPISKAIGKVVIYHDAKDKIEKGGRLFVPTLISLRPEKLPEQSRHPV